MIDPKRIIEVLFSKWFLFFVFFCYIKSTSAQFLAGKDTLRIHDDQGQEEYWIYPDDPFLSDMERELRMLFITESSYSDSLIEKQYLLPPDSIPLLDFKLIENRLARLDEQTPLPLVYNKVSARMIEFYLEDRRGMISRVLGLAQLYYPLFESELIKEGVPVELKHLAVVESALINVNRSHMGAVGLWQFMYNTARYLGMQIDTYVDERRDPIASTKTAIKYLKYLHSLYDDWYMALAAYNAGPGNVNKAIRRSGGKKTFWEIYKYLPAETRSYVPAFIAVNYVMNYSVEHNLRPVKPAFRFSEIDTVHVNAPVYFEQISKVLCIAEEELAFLNPHFKEQYIPRNKSSQLKYALTLPYYLVGEFVVNEEAIYNYTEQLLPSEIFIDTFKVDEYKIHEVSIGETLGEISQRYNLNLNELKADNQLQNNVIRPKQELKIRRKVEVTKPYFYGPDSTVYFVHKVQVGEDLEKIVAQYPFVKKSQILDDNKIIPEALLDTSQVLYIRFEQ